MKLLIPYIASWGKKENLSQGVITKYQAFMKCFREVKRKISKIIWQDHGKKILGFETDIR